jgi:retinol dehydrogenase 14
MAEMKNKVVLVTGSTDGIGKQTAIELALMNTAVIVHGRNKERVDSTVQEIQDITRSENISGFVSDLSSLKNVRESVTELKLKLEKLDVLINNAGVYMNSRKLSEDGYEMTFAVNHLAHFLLTNELLPLIRRNKNSRIVNVSSMTHTSGILDFNNLNFEKNFSPYGAYCLSKLANVLFSNELAIILAGTGITSNSLHPGVIGTKLLRAGFKIQGDSVKKGAETSVHLASSPDVNNISGKYYVNKKIASYHPIADDRTILKKFWEISEKMI